MSDYFFLFVFMCDSQTLRGLEDLNVLFSFFYRLATGRTILYLRLHV
jgi:hypothetical protein